MKLYTLVASVGLIVSLHSLNPTHPRPKSRPRAIPQPKFAKAAAARARATTDTDADINTSDIPNTITIPSSCHSSDDGLIYVKPTADGPVMPAICSSGYTMIDLSLNFDAITPYFSSWDYSKSDTYLIGPELDDYGTWRDWWAPADSAYRFRSSANCHKCYPDADHGDNSAYYQSSYYFCFSTAMEPECGEDGFDDNACAYCDDGAGHNSDDAARIWTKCTSLRFDADTAPDSDHYGCVTHSLLYRPSAVNNRDACTCYQEGDARSLTSYQVSLSDLPSVTLPSNYEDLYISPLIIVADEEIDSTELADLDALPMIYLSNSDFADGTLRIFESGNYVLTEDIILRFNEPSAAQMSSPDFSPNAYDADELFWYPTRDQSTSDGAYPGLYAFHSKFALGFFAGLSIECDDVVIDLNGHSLSMSRTLYLQQRFFSLIELGNQPFIGGQGPANWGADSVFASNVRIQGGTLGLSSHHAIHGNRNNNIQVRDVWMTQFDVAGFGCNACIDVIVADCIVGPQNTDIPVLGRYTHARAFLPRVQDLVLRHGDDVMTFHDRELTVREIADRMVTEMDMVFHHIVNGVEYDDTDATWLSAQKLFVNELGWMDGGSSYGLVFSGDGAAVVGIGCRIDGTADITIENVEIYGIYAAPIEKVKYAAPDGGGAIRLSFFDGLDWPAVTLGLEDPSTAIYIGDSYTDLVFTVNHFVESWYFLNSLRITPAMTNFVEKGDASTFAADYNPICGSDIQLHSSKGAIGMRIDGTQRLQIRDVYIHDVVNWGALGNDLCGEWHYPTISHEDPQIQYGYTGNRAQGMIASHATGNLTGVHIENIESYYGSAWGMVLYRGCEFTIENVAVSSVYAGTQLTANEAMSLTLPNYTPLACSVELRDNATVTSLSDFADVIGHDVIGHKLCNNPTNNFGDLLGECESSECRMFDGDSMTGSSGSNSMAGSGSGGDRVETAPISVDPPSLPMAIDEEAPAVFEVDAGYAAVYSACNGLSDGVQYILPYGELNEEHPLLPVMCNAGNTILDASLSFDRYAKYFSSLYMYDVGIAGPELDDFVSWRDWFLPMEDSGEFVYGVSDDCSSECLTDDSVHETAYYMTGNFYLCAWITKGDCDMDADTYECYQCARNGGRSAATYPGVCSHVATSVDHSVHDDHFECTGNNDNLKPSVGLNHQFCVCYNPTNEKLHDAVVMEESIYTSEVAILESEMADIALEEEMAAAPIIDDGSNNIVYLSNDDFLYGTFRITRPGIYILSEDIVLEFNPPPTDSADADLSPNSYDELYWLPKSDGSQDEEYMGASTWSGPYQLGFFAAITIETSNVIIDLNSFSIGMSRAFYLQQRFFSIFELAAKNFVAGQGPVDFGPYLSAAENVVIKNGIIGRASHHGIHGNDARGVTLTNLQIRDFDVAGIQLNGFDAARIENVDIGPSARDIPVTGRYLHARALLRRFAHLVTQHGDEIIAFDNREPRTVRHYVDELIAQMDLIFDHVIHDVQYSSDDAQWNAAADLFLNPNINGYGDGGVVYGILLNSRGGAVMGFGNAPSTSTNVIVRNVTIHDLAISPLEKLKFKTNPLGGATRGPVADVFDIMKVADQWTDVSTAKYLGSAYSDVQLAMSKFETSWFVLDHTCVDAGVEAWAMDGVPFAEIGGYYGGCNTDIQLHINKGVIGLRVDNVVGFELSGLTISNLLNVGALGTETSVCGAYTQGNAHQDPRITAGYTGTEGYGVTLTQSSHGIMSDVQISNIETYYGGAVGIALFKDSANVTFGENIRIDGVVAGSRMALEQLRPEQAYLPNKVPRACSVLDNQYNTHYELSAADSISASNVRGFMVCGDEERIGQCDDESCLPIYAEGYFEEMEANVAKSETRMMKARKRLSVYATFSKSVVRSPSFAMLVLGVVIGLVAMLMSCHVWSRMARKMMERKQINREWSGIIEGESTPLLPDTDLYTY